MPLPGGRWLAGPGWEAGSTRVRSCGLWSRKQGWDPAPSLPRPGTTLGGLCRPSVLVWSLLVSKHKEYEHLPLRVVVSFGSHHAPGGPHSAWQRWRKPRTGCMRFHDRDVLRVGLSLRGPESPLPTTLPLAAPHSPMLPSFSRRHSPHSSKKCPKTPAILCYKQERENLIGPAWVMCLSLSQSPRLRDGALQLAR